MRGYESQVPGSGFSNLPLRVHDVKGKDEFLLSFFLLQPERYFALVPSKKRAPWRRSRRFGVADTGGKGPGLFVVRLSSDHLMSEPKVPDADFDKVIAAAYDTWTDISPIMALSHTQSPGRFIGKP